MIPAFGKYMTMLYSIFLKPEKFSIYWKRFVDEVIQLGLKSLYYQHSMNAAQQFKQKKECASCEA